MNWIYVRILVGVETGLVYPAQCCWAEDPTNDGYFVKIDGYDIWYFADEVTVVWI